MYGDDPRGLKCPVGAHARRMNARDAVITGQVRLHRMIRRGTNYGPSLPPGVLEDDGADRGLMFAFVGAHLDRQFEFVQRQWVNDGKFIGAPAERDPLIGVQDGGEFTIPSRRSAAACRGCPTSSSTAAASTASCPACGRCAGSPTSTPELRRSVMADHFSGPRALADPASDITDVYAFPSPERPGHLVLVLNVFPPAAPTALFSDALRYRFRLRPVTATTAGGTRRSWPAPTSRRSTSDSPLRRRGRRAAVQAGTCTTPGGAEIPFRVGEEQPTEMHGLRIFAGPRLDPFFIDLAADAANHELERLAFRPSGVNTVEGANCLSIVVEFDVATVLGPDTGPLLAVVGETLTSGHPVRLERMGRPEIKNFILQDKKFDPVNRDLEIRDLYNAEDAFNLSPDYVGAYRARFNANLAFFDRLDGKIDWPPDEQGDHPLTELLLADFLVVDTSKPFTDGSFLEIERAVLAGRPHTTCGGRPPERRHRGHPLHAAGRRPRRTADQRRRRPGRPSRPPAAFPTWSPQPGSAGHESRARRGVRAAGGGGTITGLTADDRDPATTSGAIAVANLHAQIDGLTARLPTARSGQAAGTPPAVAEQVLLVDLLLLRGQVLGRIADYERAAGLAEALVRDAPDDGAAWLARARTRATFHRFAEALGDLDAAGRRGADRGALDAERAAILQAVGCYDEALVLRRNAAQRRPDFTTLGALAVLKAEHGKATEAERLFTEARRRYRGVSPFPVA